MTTPTPRPGILDIAPYVPGGAQAPGAQKIYKLSSNESALGASEKAIDAYRRAGDELHLYPDGSAGKLREKIASLHGLDASRIVCGAGSDEILQLLTRAYLGPGDNIIQTDHGFLVYALAAKSCGGEVRFAPERDLIADVDEILKLVDERTRLVFVANPNNPTGTYIPFSEIRRLRSELREDIILVIDAAYAEYMDEADYEAGETLVDEHDNVVMTRTFSKIYGLGGVRLGWGYFPAAIADVINRIRGPFNVNAPSIAAGVAALDDQDFVARNKAFNKEERDFLAQQLGGMGLHFKPSFGNFILVQFPDAPGKSATEIQSFLREHGVIVREMAAYKLPDWLRISVGPKEANRALVDLLNQKFGA
ncbi:MAG: histidinol-phosphate transaminase [Pseudomonadota bacterium]